MSHEVPMGVDEGELGSEDSVPLTVLSPNCVAYEVPYESSDICELRTRELSHLSSCICESPIRLVNEAPFQCPEIVEFSAGESVSLAEEYPNSVTKEGPFESLEINKLETRKLTYLSPESTSCLDNAVPLQSVEIDKLRILKSNSTEKESPICDSNEVPFESFETKESPTCLVNEAPLESLEFGGFLCHPASDTETVEGGTEIKLHHMDPVDHCPATVELEEHSSLPIDEPVSSFECSPQTSPDATDRLTVTEADENHRGPYLEYPPKRLFSTRNAISPSSQEKLRHAVDSDELYDSIEYTRSKSTIRPDRVLKKRKIVKNESPLVLRKGILKSQNATSVITRDGTELASIQTCTRKAIIFSQRQMHDIEGLANKLLTELNRMKEIVKETLLSEPCSHLRYNFSKVRLASEVAAEAEGTTRKWLSMMAKDCNRFCKLMRSNEGKVATAAAAPTSYSEVAEKRKKKIKFADEAGGTLCHVKFYSKHANSVRGSPDKVNHKKPIENDSPSCTSHS